MTKDDVLFGYRQALFAAGRQTGGFERIWREQTGPAAALLGASPHGGHHPRAWPEPALRPPAPAVCELGAYREEQKADQHGQWDAEEDVPDHRREKDERENLQKRRVGLSERGHRQSR